MSLETEKRNKNFYTILNLKGLHSDSYKILKIEETTNSELEF